MEESLAAVNPQPRSTPNGAIPVTLPKDLVCFGMLRAFYFALSSSLPGRVFTVMAIDVVSNCSFLCFFCRHLKKRYFGSDSEPLYGGVRGSFRPPSSGAEAGAAGLAFSSQRGGVYELVSQLEGIDNEDDAGQERA